MGRARNASLGLAQARLDRPDQLIFDFDPDEGFEWKELVTGVRLLRTLLEELDLQSFIKTTGGKGLHVVVPIRTTLDWTQAKGWTHAVADFMVSTFPDRFTATISKAKRTGKVLIDYLRNSEGATAIAPYAVRGARECAGGDAHRVGGDRGRRRALRPLQPAQRGGAPLEAEARPLARLPHDQADDHQGPRQARGVHALESSCTP
jgi:hypothetical protein